MCIFICMAKIHANNKGTCRPLNPGSGGNHFDAKSMI